MGLGEPLGAGGVDQALGLADFTTTLPTLVHHPLTAPWGWWYPRSWGHLLLGLQGSRIEGLSWPLAGLHSHGLGSNCSQVRHLYICDFHKNFIQSVRNKRKRKTSDDGGDSPEQDVDVPEVGVEGTADPSCRGPARPCVQIHLGWRFLPGFPRREFLAGVSSHPGPVFEDICLPSALLEQ